MNTAYLLMSSVLVSGADPQTPPGAGVPVMVGPVAHAAPCCAVPADGCSRRGLFSHLNLWGRKNDGDCREQKCDKHGVFHGFTTAAPCNGCDTCGGIERHGWGSGPGLLSRLKAKFGQKDCCEAAACAVPSCALPPIPGAVPSVVPPIAPEKMPAPGKGVVSDPKGSAHLVPRLSPIATGGSPF